MVPISLSRSLYPAPMEGGARGFFLYCEHEVDFGGLFNGFWLGQYIGEKVELHGLAHAAFQQGAG